MVWIDWLIDYFTVGEFKLAMPWVVWTAWLIRLYVG